MTERGHFKQWSASWYIASYHQISGHNVISSHFLIWTSPLRPGPSLSWNISTFRETRKNWPSMTILYSDLLHGTVHQAAKFQVDSGDVVPQTWSMPMMENFKVRWNVQNFNNNLFYGAAHHHTKFQANSWNPWWVKAVTLFGTDRRTYRRTSR